MTSHGFRHRIVTIAGVAGFIAGAIGGGRDPTNIQLTVVQTLSFELGEKVDFHAKKIFFWCADSRCAPKAVSHTRCARG
jgi:hypothetical protein